MLQRDVAPAGVVVAWRSDRNLGEPVVDQRDEEVGERERLRAKPVDARLSQDLDRPFERRGREQRRGPDLPRPSGLGGCELRVHLELRRLLVAPPPGERGRASVVSLGDEQRADGARARVEVLVRTPDAEVDTGVVEGVWHRSDRVCGVEAGVRASGVCCTRDSVDVEQLSRPIQRRRHEHDPDVFVCVERRLDVSRVDRSSVSALDDAELLVGVDPALAELSADRVVV